MKITDKKHQVKYSFIWAIAVTSLTASANFEITKHSINNGGGISSGGNFEVTGSIGQAVAVTEAQGGDFSQSVGFWGPEVTFDIIFINGFEN